MNTFNQLMALAEDIKQRDYKLAHRCQEIARGVDGWIKIEDGLPTKTKSKKQWQIYRSNGDQAAAFWDGKNFNVGFTIFKDVTRWQPLPTPPKD